MDRRKRNGRNGLWHDTVALSVWIMEPESILGIRTLAFGLVSLHRLYSSYRWLLKERCRRSA